MKWLKETVFLVALESIVGFDDKFVNLHIGFSNVCKNLDQNYVHFACQTKSNDFVHYSVCHLSQGLRRCSEFLSSFLDPPLM